MPRHDQRCTDLEGCGWSDEIIVPAGVNPPCPKCNKPTERWWMRAESSIKRDEIPGGIWLENYGPEPIKVYSHSERRAIMLQRGLVEKDTFVPVPGTDKSGIGTVRWDCCDAQTLENARILVSRQSELPSKGEDTYDESSVIRPFNLTGTQASRALRQEMRKLDKKFGYSRGTPETSSYSK